MDRFNQRFLSQLDTAAGNTGIPAIARGNPRRRHMRWLPLLPLLIGTGSMLLALVRPNLAGQAFALTMFAFVPASILQIFGPVKSPGTTERMDEFDRSLRSRAYFFTYAGITFAAMACLWLIIVSTMLHPATVAMMVGQLRTLSFFLLTLFFTLPVLHASWTTHPIGEDEVR